MSSLLEARDYYKPFAYPWAYEAYKVMQSIHWLPHEAPMALDVNHWNTVLTEKEKNLLTQLFRFFTQADVDIASGYFDKYAPRFKHPELRMMIGSFIAAEANHIDAYSTLIETLGLPEVEYKAFQDYAAMRKKHEYMWDRESGKSIADLAVDIAVFSAFGEGMQLFSSFALLMSFQRRGLMQGMTTIVEWSIRDETHHVESMIKLLHELIKEHPRIWNDETKKRIYDACRAMVKLEDAFIDQCTSMGEVEGFTAAEAKQYIRYIADRRLLQLGLKPNYRVKENPFPWLDWIMNAPTHTNFFEQRSTEYGKGEIHGWEHAFDGLADLPPGASVQYDGDYDDPIFKSDAPRFLIYTKPDCPHCDRAKSMLSARDIPFTAVELADASKRQEMFLLLETFWRTPNWKTSPMIFETDADGDEVRFIGGADDLAKVLAG